MIGLMFFFTKNVYSVDRALMILAGVWLCGWSFYKVVRKAK
jgi:hypothetical protein